MRSAFALAILVTLLVPGCLDSLLDDSAPPALSSAQALEIMDAWVNQEGTTTDPKVGNQYEPGGDAGPRMQGENGPVLVYSQPLLLSVEAISGQTDWDALFQLLSGTYGGHPEYHELVKTSITGRFSPHRLGDADGSGMARSWQASYLVEWAPGVQDDWKVLLGTPLHWAIRTFASPKEVYCDDLAPGVVPVDSTQAFAAALEDERFAAAVAATPRGQAWLHMQVQKGPELSARAGGWICPTEPDLTWTLRWMDLDGLVRDGEGIMATALVDSRTGVLDRIHITTMRHPENYTWQWVLGGLEPLFAPPGQYYSFLVSEEQVRLQVDVSSLPGTGVSFGDRSPYRLTAPDGSNWLVHEFAGSWSIDLPHPQPGRWTLERTQSLDPSTTAALRDIRARTLS